MRHSDLFFYKGCGENRVLILSLLHVLYSDFHIFYMTMIPFIITLEEIMLQLRLQLFRLFLPSFT